MGKKFIHISNNFLDNNFFKNKILDNALESILIIENNIITYCNESCKELLSHSNIKRNQGIVFSELFYPEEKALIDIFFNEAINKKSDEFNELVRIKSNDNRKFYYEIKIKPIEIDNRIVFIAFIKDVSKHIKSEKIATSLYTIAKAVNTTNSIDKLYKEIHFAINKIIDVKNFFIALYLEDKDVIEFPFFLDEKDEKFKIINASDKRSLTVKVIRENKPIFLNEQDINNYFGDQVIPWGTLSKVWIAVPLRIGNKVIGAIGAQSYDNPNLYTREDIGLFETLAEQIAISIAWKQTENELKLSEEKFKKAFKTSPDAVNINRLNDGLYIDINKGFTDITGYTEEEIIGKTSLEIDIWADPKDRELLVKNLREKGVCNNLEAKFRFKNGVIHTGLMSAVVINLNNEPHILSITRDIQETIDAREEIVRLNLELEQKVTERTAQLNDALEELRDEIAKRKVIQDELERYQEELANALKTEKKLSQLKSRFINMVSHEYKTPLTIISTSAELLNTFFKDNDFENHKKYTDRILSSIDDMIKLIEDVLYIGKEEIFIEKANYKKFNIVEFVYHLIEKYKLVDKDEHIINFEYSNEEILFETDQLLFNQIINNLLTNALKYTPKGKEIFIRIENHKSYISFEITDEGIGIPEQEQENIFNHFYRAENVKNIGGTGLGLSIVKRNVEALRGFINMTSVVNEGTSFILRFPKKTYN